uniref:Uncharacterized protein n=1 Tax=Globodera rostochiensis TaxID=31243 RepID=A0A914HDT0_GLORO
MIYDENANNSETSGENGASELRRRRNATKSESADDQRDPNNSRDEDNLLSELESERRPDNSNTDNDVEQHIPNSDEEAGRDSSSASSDANSDKGLDKVAGSNKPSIFDYICMELSRSYSLQNEKEQYAEKRRKVAWMPFVTPLLSFHCEFWLILLVAHFK